MTDTVHYPACMGVVLGPEFELAWLKAKVKFVGWTHLSPEAKSMIAEGFMFGWAMAKQEQPE